MGFVDGADGRNSHANCLSLKSCLVKVGILDIILKQTVLIIDETSNCPLW